MAAAPQEPFVLSWQQLVDGCQHLDDLAEEAKAQKKGNWGDESCCTHSKGYYSQPVWSCLTCSAETGKTFGFCFGCSQNCHVDHELVELFDKRNFRCDCPTERGTTCDLLKEKQPENTNNQYNHNFEGSYCWCKQGYDPDNDSMIQCFLCQDWFHGQCIDKRQKNNQIDSEEPFEFACDACVTKYKWFVLKYEWLEVNSSAVEPTPTDGCKVKGITPPTTERNESLFFVSDWRKRICQCENCLKRYSYVGLDYITKEFTEVPTEDEPMPEEEEPILVDPVQAADMMIGLGHFKDKLKGFLLKMSSQGAGTLVTEEAVRGFLQDLKDEGKEPEKKKRKLNDD